jgi:hypothetical protein
MRWICNIEKIFCVYTEKDKEYEQNNQNNAFTSQLVSSISKCDFLG